jgi:phosphatidylserine decarboxylase
MTLAAALRKVLQQEDVNFLLTNRLPRRWLTLAMGRFSKIEQPWVSRASIALLRLFAGADLSEARKTTFTSLHDCFTRELNPSARPVDPDPRVVVSPSDGIVGATGRVADGEVLQAKGFPYRLIDLLGDAELVRYYAGGCYVTLRLTAAMYHRFHAPCACRVRQVTYVSGDTWNVNPIALRRVERLFCRNERAIIRCALGPSAEVVTLVPVAAILVASIRLHFIDVLLNLKYRGPNVIACDAAFDKGEEMGWFEHGSTIIVFAPSGFAPSASVREGAALRMGQSLLLRPR